MTRLFICEKPSQARNVAAALGGGRAGGGMIETREGIVTHARGHFFELLKPDAYPGAGWDGGWSLDRLPIVPETFRYELKKDVAAQFKLIRQLLAKASEVVIASDPDREGEAIVRTILAEARYRGPTKRLWFNGEDANSIKKALGRLKPGSETEPLYFAQQARDRADFIVGMTCTRGATCAFGGATKGALHVGRVVTPTLWLVVKRDREIANFRPEDYFELVASMESRGKRFRLRHAPPAEERIKTKAEAEARATRAKGASGPLRVSKEAKRQAPPKPFTLPALQKRANNLWGWSAEKTLQTAQKLYEAKLTTYPRTDCPYLADDQWEEVPATLAHLAGQQEFAALIESFEPRRRKEVFDSAKVEAHSGLVPTLERADLGALDADARRLYLLVARTYVAMLMPDYEYLAARVSFDANGVPFWVTGQIPQKLGWKAAFTRDEGGDWNEGGENQGDDGPGDTGRGTGRNGGKDEGEAALPDVADGDPASALGIEIEAKQTKPPPHYTEATLLADMENIGKFVESPKLKKILKENAGIGTPATRDAIIKKLRDPKNGYVRVAGKKLIATDKGTTFIEALEQHVPELVNPGVTALWEEALEKIARGEANHEAFIRAAGEKVAKQVEKFRAAAGTLQVAAGGRGSGADAPPRPMEGDGGPCPACGEGSLKTFRAHKSGKRFLGCSNYKAGCRHVVWDETPVHKGKELAALDGTGSACPKCADGKLRTAVGKKTGKRFLACDRWARDGGGCDYTAWPEDAGGRSGSGAGRGSGAGKSQSSGAAAPSGAGEPCPKCGQGTMQVRPMRNGGQFLGCSAWRSDGGGCDHKVWPERKADGAGPSRGSRSGQGGRRLGTSRRGQGAAA